MGPGVIYVFIDWNSIGIGVQTDPRKLVQEPRGWTRKNCKRFVFRICMKFSLWAKLVMLLILKTVLGLRIPAIHGAKTTNISDSPGTLAQRQNILRKTLCEIHMIFSTLKTMSKLVAIFPFFFSDFSTMYSRYP